MPARIRVDNGTPWGSAGDLPTDLALWLFGLGGVSPFGEGRVSKVASTHFERFGNLAMLFFPQAPVLKCMEAVRMVTDLLGSGQTCSVVFCPAALEFCLTRMARSRSPARSRPPGAPDRSID